MKNHVQTVIIVVILILVVGIAYLFVKSQSLEESYIQIHKKMMEFDKRIDNVETHKGLKNQTPKQKPESPVMSITYQSEYTKNKSGIKCKDVSKSDAKAMFGGSDTAVNKVQYVEDSNSVFANSMESDTDNGGFAGKNIANLVDEIPSEVPPEMNIKSEKGKKHINQDNHLKNANNLHRELPSEFNSDGSDLVLNPISKRKSPKSK